MLGSIPIPSYTEFSRSRYIAQSIYLGHYHINNELIQALPLPRKNNQVVPGLITTSMNLQQAIPIIRRRSNVGRDSPTSYMAPDNSNGSSDPTSQCEPRYRQSSSTSGRVQSGELGQLRGNPSLRRSKTYRELASVIRESHNGPSKLLLFIVPIAIVSGLVGLPAVAIFLLNMAALVPLAALSIFTVLVLTRNAGFWGGFIRAVFGNAIELTV